MKTAQKKAIIIGATSGIGLEMVKVLTAQGWQVGIAGRRQERLQQIQSKNLDVLFSQCWSWLPKPIAQHREGDGNRCH